MGFLYDFSYSDLATGFKRACEIVKFRKEERSRLNEGLLRLRAESDLVNDNETMVSFFVETFCGANSEETMQGSSSKELRKWMMDSCDIMDELVEEIEGLR